METFYDNEFAEGVFYPEQHLFVHRWRIGTEKFNDVRYKQIAGECIAAVDKTETRYVVINSHDLRYIIRPDLQHWYVTQIMPVCLRKPITKIAVVLSEELLLQMVSEQVADEAAAVRPPFATKFFVTEEEAVKWLQQK